MDRSSVGRRNARKLPRPAHLDASPDRRITLLFFRSSATRSPATVLPGAASRPRASLHFPSLRVHGNKARGRLALTTRFSGDRFPVFKKFISPSAPSSQALHSGWIPAPAVSFSCSSRQDFSKPKSSRSHLWKGQGAAKQRFIVGRRQAESETRPEHFPRDTAVTEIGLIFRPPDLARHPTGSKAEAAGTANELGYIAVVMPHCPNPPASEQDRADTSPRAHQCHGPPAPCPLHHPEARKPSAVSCPHLHCPSRQGEEARGDSTAASPGYLQRKGPGLPHMIAAPESKAWPTAFARAHDLCANPESTPGPTQQGAECSGKNFRNSPRSARALRGCGSRSQRR
jgi:hypothetical protein